MFAKKLEIRTKVFAFFLQKFSFAGKLSRMSVVGSELSQAKKLWSGNGVPWLDQGAIGQSLASWIELN